MRAHRRPRYTLLIAAAAAAIAVAAAPAHSADRVLGDPVCPASTNWDNAIHTCR